MKIGTKTITVNVSELKYKINVNTLEQIASATLELNEVGICNLSTDQLIAFDPYSEDRDTGGFILIDRLTNNTVGAGMLHSAVHQSHKSNEWQAITVNKQAHADLKRQKPFIIWFSGSDGDKSSIAVLLEKKLYSLGKHTYLLDEDNIRHGLSRDLSFSDADCIENIRRATEVAKLMVDAGQIVLMSLASSLFAGVTIAREMAAQNEFLEVFINDVTSSDSSHGVSEIRIDTTTQTAEQVVEHIIRHLTHVGMLN